MLDHLVRNGQRGALGPLGQRRAADVPAFRQRRPEQPCRQGVAPEVERLDHAPERGVARLERVVHLGREPGGHIPVVGLGQDALAAAQPHPAIGDGLGVTGAQLRADLGGGLLVLAPDAIRDDLGVRGELVPCAPAIQRQRRAGMTEQIRVQRLQFGQCGQSGDRRVRPGGTRRGRGERRGGQHGRQDDRLPFQHDTASTDGKRLPRKRGASIAASLDFIAAL